jgi:hypothetical protein
VDRERGRWPWAKAEATSSPTASTVDTNLARSSRTRLPASARINGKTYGDFTCIDIPIFGILICEPHDNGEIFANVLWDMRERFRADGVVRIERGRDQHGASTLRGRAEALASSSPTMLDLRDAILTADGARNPSNDPGGSVNHCRIWDVFATRGMGAAAQDTDDTARRGRGGLHGGARVPGVAVAGHCHCLGRRPQRHEAGLQAGKFRLARTGDTSKALTVYFTVSEAPLLAATTSH